MPTQEYGAAQTLQGWPFPGPSLGLGEGEGEAVMLQMELRSVADRAVP